MQKILPYFLQLFLLLALSTSAVAADRKERKPEPLPKPPPQPVEQSVKVRRGEKLTIPLKIYGSQREPLKFLIRKEPLNGKLSEPQQRDRESALVTYEPTDDLSVSRDQFSYAVQNSAGVSAAVDVSIAILDDPPALVMPDTVDFGTLLAGQSASHEIEIANRGGGMATGELKVDLPWRIEGPLEYKLGAGESRKVKIVFTPAIPGPCRGELHFTSDRTRAVGLKGEAQPALAAVPPSVMLQPLPGDTVRTGVFELVNGTDEPQLVVFEENPRLQLRKTVEIPPKGKAVVSVQAAANSVAAVSEEIVAKGAGVELRIPVAGHSVGPVLRRLDEQLRFGLVSRAGGVGTIEVQNVGGAEGYWRWESIPPFIPAEEGCKIPAGERKTLTVRLEPGTATQYRALLKLVGEGQTVEIPAEVNVGPSAAAPVASRPSVSRPKEAVKRVSARERNRESEEETEPQVSMVAPLLHKIRKLEPTRAEIVWKERGHRGSYQLEVRSLSLDSERKLKVTWSQAPSVKLRTEGGLIMAEIDGLAPNMVYAYRLMNIPPGASSGEEVGMVQFRTPLKEPFIKFGWLSALISLLVLLGGFLAWRHFSHR